MPRSLALFSGPSLTARPAPQAARVLSHPPADLGASSWLHLAPFIFFCSSSFSRALQPPKVLNCSILTRLPGKASSFPPLLPADVLYLILWWELETSWVSTHGRFWSKDCQVGHLRSWRHDAWFCFFPFPLPGRRKKGFANGYLHLLLPTLGFLQWLLEE